MAYTKAQVHTEVRALINEPTPAFWSNAEIDEWIDMAALDISVKTHCVETTGTVTLVASTLSYAEPTTFSPTVAGDSNIIKVYSAFLLNLALQKVHPRMWGHISATASDTPRYYSHFAGSLWFYPVATGAGTVTLLCSVRTDDVTALPFEYQHLAIKYVAYMAKLKDRKYAEAAQLYAEYANGILFQRTDLQDRGVDAKEEMTIPDRVERVLAGQGA